MLLTPSEIEFVKSNYKNNTAKALAVSINNIRRTTKECPIKVEQLQLWIWNNLEKPSEVSAIPLVEREYLLIRGASARESANNRKTEALRLTLKENSNDGLSEGFSLHLSEDDDSLESQARKKEREQANHGEEDGQKTSQENESENVF